MKTKLFVLGSACLVLLAVISQASFAGQRKSQVQYEFTSIDIMGKETETYGINQGGSVVGRFVGSSFYFTGFLAFVMDRHSTTTIDVPPDLGSDTIPYGINARGKIVGSYGNSGKLYGFLYDAGVITTIDAPKAAGTVAHGINDQNVIVGEYTDDHEKTHGFLRDSLGFTTIDVADNGIAYPATIVYGINRVGEIVGSYRDWSGKWHGFLEEDGTFTEISFPDPLATDTFAYGINPQGQIVGTYIDNSGTHGFLYDGGAFTPIDVTFVGASNTSVFGINRHGNIVGTYIDAGGIGRGFVGK